MCQYLFPENARHMPEIADTGSILRRGVLPFCVILTKKRERPFFSGRLYNTARRKFRYEDRLRGHTALIPGRSAGMEKRFP